MPVLPLAEVLNIARSSGVGVPNLWGGTTEKVLGHLRAAESTHAPLSLAYVRALCPEIPLEYGVEMMTSAAKRSSAPIAVILDHGASVAECEQAIRAGVSGVMYDGSHLSFEENVKQTREVTRVAHGAGVSVEAELGAVGGSAVEYGTEGETDGQLTDPERVVEFVDRTNVDALAISVGNAHGQYRGVPHIRHDLIRTIRSLVRIPLVMHGASGLPDEEYGRIVESGITKINYYSAMSAASVGALRRYVSASDGSIGCHNVLRYMIDWYTAETRRLLGLLSADNGAVRNTETELQAAMGDLTREQLVAIVTDVIRTFRPE